MNTILITGASSGIGRAFALACAASGRYSKILLNGGHDRAALEDRYGSVKEYMFEELSVGDPELKVLRRKFLV